MDNKLLRNLLTITGSLFLLFLLLRLLNVSLPISVTTTNKTTELSVVGEGKVEVIPDTAFVDLGISVNNVETVEEAKKQIDTANNAIVASMNKLGIKKEDIKTSNYSIFPNYSYDGNVNRITGYNGNVNINIKVRDTNKVGQVISEGTKAGANQVNGTQFIVEDRAKYRSEARTKAIENAKTQAEKLAKDLGIRLGKVVNIIEYTPDVIPQSLDAMSKSGIGGGGAELEQGTQTITSVVTLYFEKR